MAYTALQLAAEVGRRSRDPVFTGTDQATVFDLLGRSQTVVNAALEAKINTVTLTVLTNQGVYSIDGDINAACVAAGQPLATRVIGVRDSSGRDLSEVQFRTLAHIDREWFRETATELRTWSLFGRDTLILRPNLLMESTAVVIYVEQSVNWRAPTNTTVIPDEDSDVMLDLTEIMLRLKGRDMGGLKDVFERLTQRVKTLSVRER